MRSFILVTSLLLCGLTPLFGQPVAWQALEARTGNLPSSPAGETSLPTSSVKPMVIDRFGNTYVVGESQGYALVASYDGTGTRRWARAFNPVGKVGTYTARRAAVDASGNVYVTVSYYGSSSRGCDLLALDSSGNLRWRRPTETCRAVAVDGSGNVYLGGQTPYGTPFIESYASSGTLRWKKGPGMSVSALAVEATGNFVVTGGGSPVTKAYDSGGNERWSRSATEISHSPVDISIGVAGGPCITGGSSSSGFFAICYDSAGSTRWTSTGSHPNSRALAIVADGSGNVFVTGSLGDSFLTVAFDANGTQKWAKAEYGSEIEGRYGPSRAFDIAVDRFGNVTVAGYAEISYRNSVYYTVSYDSNGNKRWSAAKDGGFGNRDVAYGVVADVDGNVFVTGHAKEGDTPRFLTVSYGVSGTERWAAGAGPLPAFTRPMAVALDGAGNTYLSSVTWDGEYALLVTSYSPAGTRQWEKPVRPTRMLMPDQTTPVAVWGANVFAAADNLLVSLDPEGNVRWSLTSIGKIFALAVDGAGNLYAAGEHDNRTDAFVVSYSGAGAVRWTQSGSFSSGYSAGFLHLLVDGAGNVNAAGTAWSSETHADFLLVSFTAAGAFRWSQVKHVGSEQARGLVADGSHNLYLAGESWTNYRPSMLTVSYDSAGAERWTRTRSISARGEGASAIAIDSAGNVFVTGYGSITGGRVALTVSYTSGGAERWSAVTQRDWAPDDIAYGVGVGSDGNVYVAGKSWNGNTFDGMVLSYTPAGSRLWEYRYDGGADDSFHLVGPRPGGAVVAGDPFVDTTTALTVAFGIVPISAPASILASPSSSTTIVVTWSQVTGAASYRVERDAGSGYVAIAFPTVTTIIDSVPAATAYRYRVRSADVSGALSAPSPADLATAFAFTDSPLASGTTPIRTVHFLEAAQATNAVRTLAGLPAFSFGSPLGPGMPVLSSHIVTLRSALNEARTALGFAPISASSSCATGTVIRAADVEEIRAATR